MGSNPDFLRNNEYRGVVFTAPVGGALAGNLYQVANTWVLAYKDTAAGSQLFGIYECVDVMIPKATGAGSAIAVGSALYLNTTTKVVSDTDGGSDVLVGVAEKAATDTAEYVQGNFKGGPK